MSQSLEQWFVGSDPSLMQHRGGQLHVRSPLTHTNHTNIKPCFLCYSVGRLLCTVPSTFHLYRLLVGNCCWCCNVRCPLGPALLRPPHTVHTSWLTVGKLDPLCCRANSVQVSGLHLTSLLPVVWCLRKAQVCTEIGTDCNLHHVVASLLE